MLINHPIRTPLLRSIALAVSLSNAACPSQPERRAAGRPQRKAAMLELSGGSARSGLWCCWKAWRWVPSKVPSGRCSARAMQAARCAHRPCLRNRTRGNPVGSPLAIPPMAAPQGPCCEFGLVVEHHYAEGVKGGAHPVQVRFFGKRGKHVKKMRLVPAEKAHAIARKLQGARGSTISVI